MADIKQVMSWLEWLTFDDWEDYHSHSEIMNIANAAIELLKEREATEPIFVENPYTHLPVSYCPKCREPISRLIVGNPHKEVKYCHYCGQAVKWEEET